MLNLLLPGLVNMFLWRQREVVSRLFAAVLPRRLYKTHTPCIYYHLRDKTHRLLLWPCIWPCPLWLHGTSFGWFVFPHLIPAHSISGLYPSSGRGRQISSSRRILGGGGGYPLIFGRTKGGIRCNWDSQRGKTLEGFIAGTTQICLKNEDMGGGDREIH